MVHTNFRKAHANVGHPALMRRVSRSDQARVNAPRCRFQLYEVKVEVKACEYPCPRVRAGGRMGTNQRMTTNKAPEK